jgi:drug/metabolite transporter (DMT)-like permease
MTTRTIGSFNALLMLALITFWGSSFVVVKIALKEELTPIAIATFRFLIAGALFLLSLFLKKSRQREYRLLIEKKDLPILLFLALTGVTFFFSAQYTGIKMAGASVAALFVCLLSPILIAVFSAWIFKEQLTKKQIVGIGAAAAGALTVILGGSMSFPDNPDFFSGSLILLLTPVFWAAYNLSGKKVVGKYDPFLVVTYVTVLGGLCLIPFSLFENTLYRIFSLSFHGWLAILFLAVTCSFFGYYTWFYVLKQVGATVTSSFLFVEPLVTVSLAAMFVGEVIGWSVIVGGILIFIGVYLVTMRQHN